MKKILIIGASGFIGHHLYEYLIYKSKIELIGTYKTRKKKSFVFLDCNDRNNFLKSLEFFKPDIIIWSAGEKNLNITENDPSFNSDKEVLPIKTILNYQKKVNISKPYFIFLSSDYVFSGEKGNYKSTDLPDPKTKYGFSKYYSEHEIIQNSNNYCIIRLGGVLGMGGLFFNWIYNEIRNHKIIELHPYYFSPTPINTLCEAILFCIKKQMKGVFHLSGNVRLSKFQFGEQLKKCFKNNKAKLIEKKSLKSSNIIDRSLERSLEFEGLSDLQNFLNSIKINDKVF